MNFQLCLVCYACAFASLAWSQTPALLTDPPDGSETLAPEIRAAFRPAVVEETTVHREGGRSITVQRLALDPADPVIPAVKLAPITATDIAQAPPAETAQPVTLQLITATVHPGPASFVSWTHHSADGTAREYSGWSNINFNHLGGINTFLATEAELLANPPRPKDLIIRYRIAETPLEEKR